MDGLTTDGSVYYRSITCQMPSPYGISPLLKMHPPISWNNHSLQQMLSYWPAVEVMQMPIETSHCKGTSTDTHSNYQTYERGTRDGPIRVLSKNLPYSSEEKSVQVSRKPALYSRTARGSFQLEWNRAAGETWRSLSCYLKHRVKFCQILIHLEKSIQNSQFRLGRC